VLDCSSRRCFIRNQHYEPSWGQFVKVMLGHQNRKRNERNRCSNSNYYHLYTGSNQLSLSVVILVLLVFAVARQYHTEIKRNAYKD
jgi:hypothetical protein